MFGKLRDGSHAVDGNTQNASTLEIGAALAGAAEVTQFLQFTTNGLFTSPRAIAAGTAVHIKFTLPASLVGLANNIEIGVFTGLEAVNKKINGALGTGPGNAAGYNANNMFPEYSGNTIVNTLNGAGEMEVVLTPNRDFHGVFVKLSGDNLSLALSASLFHAYILEETSLTCQEQNEVIDVLSGVRGNGSLNVASATGSVTDAWKAIDHDPSEDTYSIINTGLQVLGQVYQTVIYSTPSKPGDSVRIVLQDVGGGLLDLDLLRGFTIQPYMSQYPVGPPITNISSLMSLRLLEGVGNKYELVTAIPVAFDRVEIIMGGVSDALKKLRLYNMERFRPAPFILSNHVDFTNDTLHVAEGNSILLEAPPIDPTDEVNWYDADGNLVATGDTYFIPSVIKDGLYYARTARNGCVDTFSVHSVYLKVFPVELLADHSLYFSAIAINGATELSWKFATGLTISRYELLKSRDGIRFTSVVTLKAGDNEKGYHFTDYQGGGGDYYRLYLYSMDGKQYYSKIIYVPDREDGLSGAPGPQPLIIYPNPATAEIRLIMPPAAEGMCRLEVRGLDGVLRVVKPVVAPHWQSLIIERPSNCGSGLYWIAIYNIQNQLLGSQRLFWR